jgi:hypothetical protein
MKRNDRLYNRLALVFLGCSALCSLYSLLIFLFPQIGLNPFPPVDIPSAALIQPTVALTLAPTFPPTWTPTPEQTFSTLPTRLPDTRVPTRTPLPTRTSTPSPKLPTRSPYKFSTVAPPVLTSDKYGAACGNWGGVGGQVLDVDGSPLKGVTVVGWGGPIPEQEKKTFVSGSDARINRFYNSDSAYELYIGAPGDFDFFVVIYENGRPVSAVTQLRMVNDCRADLALINFQRNY